MKLPRNCFLLFLLLWCKTKIEWHVTSHYSCAYCWDVICFYFWLWPVVPSNCAKRGHHSRNGPGPEWPPQDSNSRASSPNGTRSATKKTLVLNSNPREATLVLAHSGCDAPVWYSSVVRLARAKNKNKWRLNTYNSLSMFLQIFSDVEVFLKLFEGGSAWRWNSLSLSSLEGI